jgi:hypothetical protein
MRKIDKDTSLKDLALIVCGVLKKHNVDAILTGGAVVSIYSENKYQSFDLDFISFETDKRIAIVLEEIGFLKEGRYYKNKETLFFIEFPSPPVAVGNKPLEDFCEITTDYGYLKLLTPTQCVMDRLAAFYHWNDRQSLYQAILVAKTHAINFEEIKQWSIEENSLAKYELFLKNI